MTEKDLNQRHDTEGGKSSYEPPTIDAIGTVEELTLGGAGSRSDMVFTPGAKDMTSRAPG